MSASGTHRIVTRSVEETFAAGESLGELVRPGDVVALWGGLGAGKTALTQGIAKGLGAVGHVPSPTFNILLVHRARLTLNHFDLYRLERADQLEDIDFYATVESDGVSVIEWADRFPSELPHDRLDVSIDVTAPEERSLGVTGTGERSAQLAAAWSGSWDASNGGRP